MKHVEDEPLNVLFERLICVKHGGPRIAARSNVLLVTNDVTLFGERQGSLVSQTCVVVLARAHSTAALVGLRPAVLEVGHVSAAQALQRTHRCGIGSAALRFEPVVETLRQLLRREPGHHLVALDLLL